MAAFDPAIEAQLGGRTVRLAPLVAFDFRSGMVRLWPGFGPVELDGSLWQGIGNLGQLSSINAGPGQAAEEVTFSLFADDTLLGKLSDDADEAIDREVEVFFQFFQVDQFENDDAVHGAWIEWQPLGDPLQVWWGIMGPLTAQRPVVQPGEQARRIVSVSAQNAFTNRRRPVNAFWSDRDQKARSAGDNICICMSGANIKIPWPKFT